MPLDELLSDVCNAQSKLFPLGCLFYFFCPTFAFSFFSSSDCSGWSTTNNFNCFSCRRYCSFDCCIDTCYPEHIHQYSDFLSISSNNMHLCLTQPLELRKAWKQNGMTFFLMARFDGSAIKIVMKKKYQGVFFSFVKVFHY